MALRKQLIRNIPSDSQQTDKNTQEDESDADSDDGDEFSSLLLSTSKEKRQKERENKAKPKEMTEEEMMDLAMRLSEKEASDNAFQQQQEEAAMMKAIQESMVGQTQSCFNSQSKTLLADASLRLISRRKLSYSTGEMRSTFDQGLPEDGSTPETDLKSAKRPGDENIIGNKKRKRRAGSPLLEMPDLSQSQDSPHSPESFSAPLDSPQLDQNSDSTQIDDSELQKSPVFPLTGRRVAVQIDRLSPDLLETCRSSGFVLCSQDSWTFSQKSVQPRSPTFPRTNPTSCSKSPVFSEMDQGDRDTKQSPDCVKSSDIGRNVTSPDFCRLPDCENSAFVFSSQESLTPSATSCCPKSPVFPQSPKNPLHSDGLSPKSPDRGETEQDREHSGSPVFGMTSSHTDLQKNSVSPSATELRGSNGEEKMKDKKSDGFSHDEFNTHPSKSDELNEKSKHWNSSETELTSDMTLVWSDEGEEDNTLQPVGSPSPVFPEERPAHQADHQTASQNHDAAGSSGKTGPVCSLKTQQRDSECNRRMSPATASTSTSRQQISTTEKLPPISRQEVTRRTSPPPEESSNKQSVHYYWGVPFCPRGLDPDRYTQVILAQMEVYEKSLKTAQRFLLRKAEWGEAVQPQPEKSPSPEAPAPSPQPQVPRRRGLRLRGRKTSETLPADEEESKEEKEEEEQQEKEEEKKNKDDEEQMDTDDCDVCPETQLSNADSADDLVMVTDGEAEILSQKSPKLPEVEMILRSDSPFRTEPCEDEELGVTQTKTKKSISGSNNNAGFQSVGEEKEVMEDRRDPDVEEIKNAGLRRSASPELEAAVVPHSPNTSVDCPICQASFPVSEIEMHAAYCDGEVSVVAERRPEEDRFQETVMIRRKRIRRTERKAEDTIDPSNRGRNHETCYICQKDVPLRDYSRHTELCYLRSTSRTAAKGNLLSALEKTENRDSAAGPSGSKRQPEAVIDLRDDDDDDEDAAVRISNSPIRSFTSISDATGCLIDFKKQQRSKKPSQRRR